MNQTDKTAATKRIRSAVAMATLWLAGAWGSFAADAPAAAASAGVEYFVATNGADTGNDGKSWKQAFLSIGKALEQPDVTSVTVANGTYSITKEIAVNRAVTLRSFGNGVYGGLANARQTVLQGDGGYHRMVSMRHPAAVLDGCTIRGGNGPRGAGVELNGGGTVSNCVITANNGGPGAGVFATGGSACTIVNSEITDNTCSRDGDQNGGGISAQGNALLLVRNSLIARNFSSEMGGALFTRACGKVVFENCTITRNSTATGDKGSGIFMQDGNEVLLTNCVVFGNGPGVDVYRFREGTLAVAYSCIGTYLGSVALGDGVLSGVDPQFRDASEGDYQLCTTSPCLDKGTNQPWMDAGQDLAGNPRRQAVRGAAAVVDLGAYEHQAGLTMLPKTVVIDNTTLWRHFHVAGPSRIRLPGGELKAAQIDWAAGSLIPQGNGPGFGDNWVGTVTNVFGGKKLSLDTLWSAPPPPEWTSLGFDDSDWPRLLWPQPTLPSDCNGLEVGTTGRFPYDTVLVLARTTFLVGKPAKVKTCRLSLDYWGGVVVYLNGTEVARGHLGRNAVSPTDSAEEYPNEAYLTDSRLRDRRLRDIEIPLSLLRPGANVLAVEAHMSPIEAKVAEAINNDRGGRASGWPPVGLLNARLTMSETGAGVLANRSRPPGMQVWNCASDHTTTAFDYGSPAEPLRPIVVRAGRNSVFSGRLVVSSDQPIKRLQVKVGDLEDVTLRPRPGSEGAGARTRQSGSRIAASAVRVRYAVPATPDKCWLPPHRFDGLSETIPAEIPLCVAGRARDWTEQLWHYSAELKIMARGAVAPLWFTVRVPRDTAPGLYEGQVTVAAEGLPATTVPLQVRVSAWTAPDPRDFRVQNFLHSAEEVIPPHYGVAIWSDRHFELFGRVLALLAEVNSRQVQANLTTDFQGGGSNPESLVRWIKQADGSFKYDFTIFDKFLDQVARSIGKPNTLRLNCWGPPDEGQQDAQFAQFSVTGVEAGTGRRFLLKQPPLGTEESYRFWKPVIEEALKRIETRGWLAETTFGYTSIYGTPSPAMVDMADRLWPKGEWSWTSHMGEEGSRFKGSTTNVLMTVRHADGVKALPSGKLPPIWTLEAPRRNTFTWTCRTQILDRSPLPEYRRQLELLAMSRGFDGVSDFGANQFPLKRPSGGYYVPTAGRGTRWDNTWGAILALLYPGPDGPLATERFEMFREGLELCEARLYVQNAIAAKKLSPDLAQRASQYLHPTRDAGLGERVIAVQRGWFSARMMPSLEDARLLDLAGEVARELAGKK